MPITVVSAGRGGGQIGVVAVTRHDPVETVGQVRTFAPTPRCHVQRPCGVTESEHSIGGSE